MPLINQTSDAVSDKTARYINQHATRAFRDMADGDYIAARLAFRAGLIPQGLWSAQQAFEKYLKYILLVNRISSKTVGHNIAFALRLLNDVMPKVEMSEEGRAFFDHVAKFGSERYLTTSHFVQGYVLLDLDRVVWELRRYCQVFNVHGQKLRPDEKEWIAHAHERLKNIREDAPSKFRLDGGLLEKIVDQKEHPARSALIWQNYFFGSRAKTVIRVRDMQDFSNASLWNYPEMLDELLKYVYLSKPVVAGYREHLRKITADPTLRP